ncbi:unnamed protein product [Mycena citricolor]|uniref:DNA helicase n=1 Tax=Mycena citricolor TaxID=2018698 RepID=A0AAD2GUZ7_9AGAR|nr:unnamed protein product [Mycena citricolor]
MTSETRLAEFFARQRLLLAQERAAEVERSSLLLSNCGPKLLEQKGLSLAGLGVVNVNIGLGGKTLVELERPTAYHTSPLFPPHTFRPGDLARIETNVTSNAKKTAKKTESQPQTEGVVYRVTDTRIVIAVDGGADEHELEIPERCRVVKLANNVTYDRRVHAWNESRRDLQFVGISSYTGIISIDPQDVKLSLEKHRLVQILLAMTPRSPEAPPPAAITFFDDTLNDSQKAAVQFCLQAPEVACIHGPPGTGKTHTLIEVIRQLTSTLPKRRILICGASNLSVDNILERLLALPDKLKVTRIGHPARVMANQGVLDSTLEVKAGRTEQAVLAKDVKNELETALSVLSGKGKGKAPRGLERRKMWDEVKALRKEYRQREGGVVESVLSESQVGFIVLATCHSAGGRQLRNHEFDVVIIDEATQALEAVCWVPILKGKKLILAGDPMQLPPTVLSKTKTKTKPAKKAVVKTDEEDSSDSENSGDEKPAKKGQELQPPRTLETTLFDRLERMYGGKVKRMLQVQYRMHADICAFPSNTLYASKLTSSPAVASRLLKDLPGVDGDEELAAPVVLFDTAGCEYFERSEGDSDEGSRCNENEATVVKNWVDKLTSCGLLPSQIAVISPYQAQVTLLSSILRPVYGLDIEIGTVDGMQGREKEAVIISLVRSNDKREVGFLKEKRRLNVAMTRAKRHLCVVGDSGTVSHGGRYLKRWMSWLEENADVRYAGLD